MPDLPFKIIDVSKWQNEIDFQAAKDNSQIQGVMIRSSYGSYDPKQIDTMFENHMRNAIAANMLIGTYHYGYARSVEQAEREADFAISVISPYKDYIKFPVAYGVEDAAMNVGKELVADMVIAFCNKVKAAGFKPMLYLNLVWANNYCNMDRINEAGIDVWLAEYNSYCKYTDPKTMWQFTDALSISGYPEPVDASWVYKNYE